MATRTTKTPGLERRAQKREPNDDHWRTALTCIEPNKIIVRGYPLDELMGRLTFGEVRMACCSVSIAASCSPRTSALPRGIITAASQRSSDKAPPKACRRCHSISSCL